MPKPWVFLLEILGAFFVTKMSITSLSFLRRVKNFGPKIKPDLTAKLLFLSLVSKYYLTNGPGIGTPRQSAQVSILVILAWVLDKVFFATFDPKAENHWGRPHITNLRISCNIYPFLPPCCVKLPVSFFKLVYQCGSTRDPGPKRETRDGLILIPKSFTSILRPDY